MRPFSPESLFVPRNMDLVAGCWGEVLIEDHVDNRVSLTSNVFACWAGASKKDVLMRELPIHAAMTRVTVHKAQTSLKIEPQKMTKLQVGNPIHLVEQDLRDKSSAQESFLSRRQHSRVQASLVRDNLLNFFDRPERKQSGSGSLLLHRKKDFNGLEERVHKRNIGVSRGFQFVKRRNPNVD